MSASAEDWNDTLESSNDSGRSPRLGSHAGQDLQTRVPPHNIEADASLLGAMLLSRDAIADALEVVKVEHFYKPSHGHVFEAICGLYAAGEPADPVTVAEALTRADLLAAIGGPG